MDGTFWRTLALLGLPFTLLACSPGSGHAADSGAGVQEKVTLSEPEITLAALFDRLSELTGIQHRYDPEARYQHVAVFVRERPVNELRHALEAELLWTHGNSSRDGARGLYFFPSKTLHDESDRLLRAEAQQYRAGLLQAFHLATLDENSPEWQETRREHPGPASLLNFGSNRKLMQGLGALPADAMNQILSGQTVTLRLDQLPAAQQSAFREAYAASNGADYGPITHVSLSLTSQGTRDGEMLDVSYGFGKPANLVHLYTGHTQTMTALAGPGETVLRREHAQRRAAMQADPFLQAVVPAAKDELDLMKQPRGTTNMTLTMLDLHRRTGIPMVADLYPHLSPGPDGLSGARLGIANLSGRPVWSVLQQLAEDRWRLEQGWVLVRDPRWAQNRLKERQFHPGQPGTRPIPAGAGSG